MPFKKGETPRGAIPFQKGQSGNPAGKPPKVFKAIMQEMKREGHTGLKQANIIEAYEILIGLPETQLIRIVGDSNLPMLMRICAKRLLAKDGFEVIEKMLDRAHGKAKQSTDITTLGESITPKRPDFSKLTKEELKQLMEITGKIIPNTQ